MRIPGTHTTAELAEFSNVARTVDRTIQRQTPWDKK
jgi:hypothetical protein